MLPLAMTEAKPTNPENTLTIELKDGNVVIELYPDVAQNMWKESRSW